MTKNQKRSFEKTMWHCGLTIFLLIGVAIPGCSPDPNPLAEIKVGMQYSEALDRLDRFGAKPDQLEIEQPLGIHVDSFALKSGRVFVLEGKEKLDKIEECLNPELRKGESKFSDVQRFYADR